MFPEVMFPKRAGEMLCEKIFSEKQSGRSTDGRPEFGKLMKVLLPRDVVVVTRLDRLARSSRDLRNIILQLSSLTVGFRSLGEAWWDTTTDVGRLMLTIMGGIAEFERSLIRSRTEAGIERAKRLGKKFGRPARLDEGQKRAIPERHGKGATMPELPRNTESASALYGGHFNPSPAKRRRKGTLVG
jgi:DNA invertase Pin-like site-specific DNA recombinase